MSTIQHTLAVKNMLMTKLSNFSKIVEQKDCSKSGRDLQGIESSFQNMTDKRNEKVPTENIDLSIKYLLESNVTTEKVINSHSVESIVNSSKKRKLFDTNFTENGKIHAKTKEACSTEKKRKISDEIEQNVSSYKSDHQSQLVFTPDHHHMTSHIAATFKQQHVTVTSAQHNEVQDSSYITVTPKQHQQIGSSHVTVTPPKQHLEPSNIVATSAQQQHNSSHVTVTSHQRQNGHSASPCDNRQPTKDFYSDVSKQQKNKKRYDPRYPLPEKPRQKRAVIQDMVRPLKKWLLRHRHNPYPTKAEKVQLAIGSNMSMVQVSNWFANARRRLKNVVQEQQHSSWSRRLRLYNQFVQGNAELLSISSDDSIWNSDDEEEGKLNEQPKRGQNRTQSLQSVDDDEDDQEIDVIDDKNFSQDEDCDNGGMDPNSMSSKYKTSILNRYLADSIDAHDDPTAAIVRNPDESKIKSKTNELVIKDSNQSRKRSIEQTTSDKLISTSDSATSQSPKKQKISSSHSFDQPRPIIQGPPNFLLFPPFSPTIEQSFRPGNFLYRNVLPAPPPPPAPSQVRQSSELISPYGFLPIQPTFSLPHIFQPEPTSPWAQLSAAQASAVFQIPDCHGIFPWQGRCHFSPSPFGLPFLPPVSAAQPSLPVQPSQQPALPRQPQLPAKWGEIDAAITLSSMGKAASTSSGAKN